MSKYRSTKLFSGFSCCFRQHAAKDSHCRFLHGYAIEFKITFACKELDHRNWCWDFGNNKEIKDKLATIFDHTTVIAIDDPYFENFKRMHGTGVIDMRQMDAVGCEKFAEFVARFVDVHVRGKTNERVWVHKVECIENKTNSAIFMFDAKAEV